MSDTPAPSSTKRFCTGCGVALPNGVRFCSACGTPAGGAPAGHAAQHVHAAAGGFGQRRGCRLRGQAAGFFDRQDDLRRAADAGADAALIGTALMRAPDPGAALAALLGG